MSNKKFTKIRDAPDIWPDNPAFPNILPDTGYGKSDIRLSKRPDIPPKYVARSL